MKLFCLKAYFGIFTPLYHTKYLFCIVVCKSCTTTHFQQIRQFKYNFTIIDNKSDQCFVRSIENQQKKNNGVLIISY